MTTHYPEAGTSYDWSGEKLEDRRALLDITLEWVKRTAGSAATTAAMMNHTETQPPEAVPSS